MKTYFSDYATGARLATDLVITSAAVSRTGDLLTGPPALANFLAERDLHPSALADGGSPSNADLDEVRALRREIRLVLETVAEADVAEAAAALVARAATRPSLCRDADGRWQWCIITASPDASLADELAVVVGTGLLGVVRNLSHDRIRHCAADDCDGMFVDTSKAGRRRYCMPGVCGNRRNVASYRARLRQKN
jgi:predicted RNA-binding Zn ribbon-like protein